jgi:hypothetical protein
MCLTIWKITTGQFQHHSKASTWPSYDVLYFARRLKTTNTNLFILLDYPNPYIYFIFNFDSSTLKCFKLAEFVLFCKAEQQKFLLILQGFHIKATKKLLSQVPNKTQYKMII